MDLQLLRISLVLSDEWSTSTRMWKSCCGPTSKLQGKVHISVNKITECLTYSNISTFLMVNLFLFLNSLHLFWIWMVQEEDSLCIMSPSEIWLSGYVCGFGLFQVGDHGADGRVTRDIIWTALPLGPEWVPSTKSIRWSSYAHITQRLWTGEKKIQNPALLCVIFILYLSVKVWLINSNWFLPKQFWKTMIFFFSLGKWGFGIKYICD